MNGGILGYQDLDEEQAQVAIAASQVFSADRYAVDGGAPAGWFAVAIPEEFGGAGGSALDLAVVLDACGAAMAASSLPFSAGVVGRLLCRLSILETAGSDLLKHIAEGGLVRIPAASSASDLPDVSAPVTLSILAAGPPGADLVVPARRGGQFVLLRVPTAILGEGAPAIRASTVAALDPSRPWTRLTFDDLDLRACVVAEDPQMLELWQRSVGVVCALDSVGAARTALARTVAYAGARQQFGRPLGSFQAYKHRCAEAFVDLKLAQSLAFRAAVAGDKGNEVAHEWAAAVEATRGATAVCRAAVQLHGGIGFSYEGEVHTFLRRARANEILANPQAALVGLLAALPKH